MDVDALRDRNEEKAERQAEASPASSAVRVRRTRRSSTFVSPSLDPIAVRGRD
jgi:hypothetical protein